MKRYVMFCLALAACGGAADIDDLRGRPLTPNQDLDWRDQIIYQIMVDRFENGDPNNDYLVELSAPGRFHGGDWQGIIDRLDYLEDLGVTTLWISPTFTNTEEDAGFTSYHGYWPFDLIRPNPHFGDLWKLRELTDAAHQRGMLVILDVVVNHMGQLFYYDVNGNGRPDDFISGGGTSHTCAQICFNADREHECTEDEKIYCKQGAGYLERIIEWDPEYDPRGIQGWTSGGYHGPASVRFTDWPAQKRTKPPRPPEWFGWPKDKPWFDDPSWYHRKGRVYTWWHESQYSRDFVRDQEVLGDFPGGLKDLDTDHPDVQEALIRTYEYWIDVGDFDGFRIDTIKHMDRPELDPDVRGFIGAFATRIRAYAQSRGKHNFLVFGEAFDGNDQLSGAYTFPGQDAQGKFSRLDSVFYFSQYYSVVKNVFMKNAPTRNIECLFRSRMGLASPNCSGITAPVYHDRSHAEKAAGGIGLSPQQVLVNFLDNHDIARFLFAFTEAGGPAQSALPALDNALFFLMTWDGIPCIYYGTEQLFDGGVDPGNREDMFAGQRERGISPFARDHQMFQRVQSLIALRKAHVALRRGTTDVLWSTDRPAGATDHGVFAFSRSTEEERLVVVLNTANQGESTTCAPAELGGGCMTVPFAPGTVLTDIAPGGNDKRFVVSPQGTVAVSVPARGGRVLAEVP